MTTPITTKTDRFDLNKAYRESGISKIMDELDKELVGLVPVKKRIEETAALLMVNKARQNLGIRVSSPTLHMCFTGNPGTGKTTVAMKMARLLFQLDYIKNERVTAVTRDDLVGQYIGHTAPKTKEIIKKAMGGILFIDEAYYLYRPKNERDYGQESIEILLQIMENNRNDLVVILAGYENKMEEFFTSNPGFRSRIAHHIDFPDYNDAELLQIAEIMLSQKNYRLNKSAINTLKAYIQLRRRQPYFANARSIRNALDRAILRQANRLFNSKKNNNLSVDDLCTISTEDIGSSRVFEIQKYNPTQKNTLP